MPHRIDPPSDPLGYLANLSVGMERPFREEWYPQLLETAQAEWDDVFTLAAIFFEAQLRVRKRPSSRAWTVVDEVGPRLSELLARQFPRDPDARPGQEPFVDSMGWPQVGVLKQHGYTVGAGSPGEAARRAALSHVFRGPLDPIESPEYMEGWGSDQSWTRLHKMAWSIAAFANSRLRRQGGLHDATTRMWSSDLEWLRTTYYEGHFGFPWPDFG